jgi:hypothetical protein
LRRRKDAKQPNFFGKSTKALSKLPFSFRLNFRILKKSFSFFRGNFGTSFRAKNAKKNSRIPRIRPIFKLPDDQSYPLPPIGVWLSEMAWPV